MSMKLVPAAIAMAALALMLPASAVTDGEVLFRPTADTYLESDGTGGGINTGYYVTPKTRIEADYRVLSTNGTRYLYGCFWKQDAKEIQYGQLFQLDKTGAFNEQMSYYDGTTGQMVWPLRKTAVNEGAARYQSTFDLKNRQLSVRMQGTAIESVAIPADAELPTSGTPLALFFPTAADGQTFQTGNQSSVRLYSLAIFDDDVLVRDFIPYGAGAVTGLLDRCTGKVYQPTTKPTPDAPLASDKFKLGTDAPSVTFDRNRNQFFDTGVYVTPKTKIDVEFTLLSTVTNGDAKTDRKAIFGAGTGTGLHCHFVTVPNSGGRFAWTVKDGDNNNTWIGNSLDYADRRIIFDLPGDQITLYSGTNVSYAAKISTTAQAAPTGTTSDTLRLGYCVNGPWNCPDIRIRSAKIWEDGQLVRDYVPRMVDNVMGLQDIANDTFKTAVATGSPYELGGGGAVSCDSQTAVGKAANLDAYVESQLARCYVETDYTPNYKSRIEFDAAPLHTNDNMRLYGCDFVNQYVSTKNNQDMFEFKPAPADKSYSYAWVGPSSGTARYQSFIDWPKGEVGFVIGGVTNVCKTFSVGEATDVAKYPLHIFGFKNVDGDLAGGCHMRFFGMSIYEDGELVRKFLPCQIDGEAGLWEVCKGNFLTSNVSGGLSFAGAGTNGGGMVFSDQPKSCELKIDGEDTLVAFAPTAVAYQWYKNGEPIPRATEGTLKIAWERSPRTSVYKCVAFYALAGQAESAEATVLNEPLGVILIFR